MRRRATAIFVALIVMATLIVAGASTGGATAETDTSPNVRLLRKVRPQGLLPAEVVFKNDLMFVQTLGPTQSNGFLVYRLLEKAPYLKKVSQFVCPGSDHAGISVWGDLLIQSVSRTSAADLPPPTEQCNNTDASWGKVGLRIVDISDPRKPRQVAFVETMCGSSGHTLVPDEVKLYAYVTQVDFADPGCSDDLPAPSFQIQVVKIDVKDPSRSAVVSTPTVGQLGGCHEIWVFAPRDVAVCTALGDSTGLQIEILDVSDPPNPSRLSTIREPEFAPGMNGAAFTWDGRYMAMALVANPTTYPASCAIQSDVTMGAVKLYDMEDLAAPTEVGRYTIERSNLDTHEVCFPADFSFIPFRKENRIVAAIPWEGNGLTIVDFSDPSSPREIGHYYGGDAALQLARWHNGRIYMVDLEILRFFTGMGGTQPALVIVEMDGTKRSTTRWFKGPHNPRTQVPRMLR